MASKSSIVAVSDLTPFFTESMKEKKVIEEARLVERADGSKAVEIKFYSHVPKTERAIRIVLIGRHLLNMCAELDEEGDEENKQFLEFMDGAQIKEWEEEQKKQPGDKWKENIMKRFTTAN